MNNSIFSRRVSVGIVLYKNDTSEIENLLKCLLYTDTSLIIIVIDNSPFKSDVSFNDKHELEYHHLPHNPGFGTAHNIGFKRSIELGCDYHFIINPDVYFTFDLVNTMVYYMEKRLTIGVMMPELINIDGSIQFLPKKLPYPWEVLLRSMIGLFPGLKSNFSRFLDNYELRNVPRNRVYRAPLISGAFCLYRLKVVQEIGLFDERFFMYFEDWDLSRRINSRYLAVYNPQNKVIHRHEAGSRGNLGLFKIFIKSMFLYFFKWGWIFDEDRNIQNKTLNTSIDND